MHIKQTEQYMLNRYLILFWKVYLCFSFHKEGSAYISEFCERNIFIFRSFLLLEVISRRALCHVVFSIDFYHHLALFISVLAKSRL